MSTTMVLENAKAILADPSGKKLSLQEVHISVQDGKTVAISSSKPTKSDCEFINCRGLVVLPGIIDSQVHFREPGLEHKEDLETGTRSAVLGGVTTVFEMPNTNPSTTTADAFNEKLRRIDGRIWSDIGFFIGATPENAGQLGKLERLPHCVGIKIFMGSSTGSLLVADDLHLEAILESGTRRVAVHAEDEARLISRKSLAAGDVRNHPIWRDEETARLATERILRLARSARRPLHILHVTTSEEVSLLSKHLDLVSAEVTPQHLTLQAPECYETLGTLAQMNPPIRDQRHREALWRGVETGVLSVLGSDHAPHTREEKAKPYPSSPSGMTGVQTLVPLMLNHINEGRLSIEKFCELAALNPASIYGLKNKGKIAIGNDADFTLVDMNVTRTISNSWIASRCGWTPYDGMSVKGWPVMTIVRGHVVMRDDQLLGKPIGLGCDFDPTPQFHQ